MYEVPSDLPRLFLWISCFIACARLHVFTSFSFSFFTVLMSDHISRYITCLSALCPAFWFCLYDRTYILFVYSIFILFHIISPHCVSFIHFPQWSEDKVRKERRGWGLIFDFHNSIIHYFLFFSSLSRYLIIIIIRERSCLHFLPFLLVHFFIYG